MSSNKRRATNVEIKTSKAFIICLFNPFSLVDRCVWTTGSWLIWKYLHSDELES